ncbi:thermonuclease family protein [Streptomyces altiplanensis]
MNTSRPFTTAVLTLALSTGAALAACGSGGDAGEKNDTGAVTSEEPAPREDTTPPEELSPPNEPAPQEQGRQGTGETGTETETGTEAKPPAPPAAESRSTVVVERIVDGDTIKVRGDGEILPPGTSVSVRLLEIDAPETGDCYSGEATERIARLLPLGSSVRVERDEDLKDRYDRYLLYVWNDKDQFVNESLVRTGHAEAVLHEPNDKYWPMISQAGDTAEETGSGLWSECDPETDSPPPADPPPPADTPPPSDTPEPEAPAPEPAAPEGAYPPGPPAGPDLDCSDLPGPVMVGSDDPHRLDRDGDGIGCE